MQRPHLPPRRSAGSTLAGPSADPATDDGGPSEPQSPSGSRVNTVHRMGAYLVASVIFLFGALGFLGGLAFFSTSGSPILGMSTNGLLSTISVVTAAVLVVGAGRGPKVASTVMLGIGALFLVSALANLALLRTSFNVLAFELSNVVFSVIACIVLMLTGAYGRFSGKMPPDSPYARPSAFEPGAPEAVP